MDWLAERHFWFSPKNEQERILRLFDEKLSEDKKLGQSDAWYEFVRQSTTSMGITDYVVFFFCLGLPIAVGIFFMYQSRKKKAGENGVSLEEYMMASNSVGVIPLATSIVTSFMSAITVLGVPAEVPNGNAMYGWFVITFAFVCGWTAYVFVPVFWNMQVRSTYEYLNKRFGHATRLMGVLAFLIQTILYLGIVIYAPALALSKTTGMNLWGAVVGTGVACTVYTCLGGMKAVIWTSVFQAMVMLSGFLAVIIYGGVDKGWSEIWKINSDEHRLDMFQFNPDIRERHTIWSVLIAGQMVWLSLYATSQAQVQRYMSSKSLKAAQAAIMLNVVGLFFINIAALMAGMVIFAYWNRCDPIKMGRIDTSDQYFPYFILTELGKFPGITGLHVSSVYAGSLSTVSSGINAMSMCTIEDFIKPRVKWSDKKLTNFSMVLVLIYGVAAIGVAYLASKFGPILQASLSILGILGGPLVATFTMGVVFPFANQKGVITGALTGCLFGWMIFTGQKFDVKDNYLKNIIPATIDFYECSDPNWVSDVRNFVSGKSGTFEGCEHLAELSCESLWKGEDFVAILDEGSNFNVSKCNFFCDDFSDRTSNINSENAWQYLIHMSYLYISFTCFWVSLVTGLIVSMLTGGLSEEYRRSHPVKMFKTFFPQSWYCPQTKDYLFHEIPANNERECFTYTPTG